MYYGSVLNCLAGLFLLFQSTSADRIKESDLDLLAGKVWKGTLTYKDYGTGKLTTIPSNLWVARIPDRDASWKFTIGYSDEPEKGSSETVSILEEGRKLGAEVVVERRVLKEGRIRSVTEEDGQDDNRAARIRHVYTIGESACSFQKLVRFVPKEKSVERHIYRWKSVPSPE